MKNIFMQNRLWRKLLPSFKMKSMKRNKTSSILKARKLRMQLKYLYQISSMMIHLRMSKWVNIVNLRTVNTNSMDLRIWNKKNWIFKSIIVYGILRRPFLFQLKTWNTKEWCQFWMMNWMKVKNKMTIKTKF